MTEIPHFRWWIGILLFIAAGLSFFDRQFLSIPAPEIVRDIHLNDATHSRGRFGVTGAPIDRPLRWWRGNA